MTTARMVEFRGAVEPPWTHFAPVVLGAPLGGQGTRAPDRHVLVTEQGMPALRLDLYCDLERSEHEDASFVGEWLAVGYGARVFLVSLALPRPRSPREVALGAHFCGFFALPTERALLVASARTVTRVGRSGRVAWTSPALAEDGVRIERVRGDHIEGVGGGAFRIRLADGALV